MSEDEDTCKKSTAEDKKHEPDWNTVKIDHDGGGVYVDVSCKHCGRSGCIGNLRTLELGIDW